MQPTVRPRKVIDLAHPFAVALGEVVVHGDDVHALAGERVEIDRQGRDQRLAFAGLHLGDHAAMQDDAAHQLHVEMALAEGALGRLAHGGEGLDQDVVELLALGQPVLELLGAGAQLVIDQRRQLRLERVDVVDQRTQTFDVAIVCGTKQSPGEGANHLSLGQGKGGDPEDIGITP